MRIAFTMGIVALLAALTGCRAEPCLLITGIQGGDTVAVQGADSVAHQGADSVAAQGADSNSVTIVFRGSATRISFRPTDTVTIALIKRLQASTP
jgi:hypothetical protein